MKDNYLNDNWADRASHKCETCMWFVPKRVVEEKQVGNPKAKAAKLLVLIGRCRRHSPTMSGFPVVFPNDFCGDHKLA